LSKPEIILDFDLRKWRIVQVLLENLTDVIALEEVDQFYGFFQPLLGIIGYEGLFIPKPCSPCIASGWYSDGCALFWKRETLELIRHESRCYANCNQVYTIATMRHLETECVMLLAVTHLKSGKGIDMEKIRMVQVQELKNHIHQIAEVTCKEKRLALEDIPIIVMGDFNSDPSEDQSCIGGFVSISSQCGDGDGNDNDVDSNQGDGEYFASAYPISSKDVPFFTTWKVRGVKILKRVIDYIFYKKVNAIKCSHILSIPREDELEESKLPGLKYPSDHLAIGAKFHLQRKRK
jgi:mRNA deadenylase 3'-5' endonuclease subunit Ccr4